MGEQEENFFLTCGDSVFFLARTVLSGSYKIVLNAATLVLAIKIRKVPIPALDDARYVAVMVYVATVFSLILIPTSWTLVNYPNTYASILLQAQSSEDLAF